MPDFNDHIEQTTKNLAFLEKINLQINDCFDWQVTVCFYSALHLVNAHVAYAGQQYRKHSDVTHFINPANQLSVGKISQDAYAAYISLMSLSRRSRYLVEKKDNQIQSEQAKLTYEKHLAKAIRHLNTIMRYFADKYTLSLPLVHISCVGLTYNADLQYFSKPE